MDVIKILQIFSYKVCFNYRVSQKTPDIRFDVSWKRLYLHHLISYFLNPHTSTKSLVQSYPKSVESLPSNG